MTIQDITSQLWYQNPSITLQPTMNACYKCGNPARSAGPCTLCLHTALTQLVGPDLSSSYVAHLREIRTLDTVFREIQNNGK